MASPCSVIAGAMDAWRIRMWLRRGPRCPCGCSERIPWSTVNSDAFVTCSHIPTERRRRCMIYDYNNEEERYIPPTLEGFKAYMVERRNVLHGFGNMLYSHCMHKGQAWMCQFLSYGHATQIWRSPSHPAFTAIQMLFRMVAKNWFDAANIILRWSTVTALLTEEDILYLTKKPYRTGYEFMDIPLSAVQRNWLLHHPALTEQTRKARNHKYWMQILLWTGFVKIHMRAWKAARVPLPTPSKKAIPLFVKRIESIEFHLHPGTPFYQDMLIWVAFLAMESPGTLHKLLPQMGYKSQWLADVIEVLAPTGRIGRLSDSLRIFGRYGDPCIQVKKIWQWANDPLFATPRITKALLYMATYILPWARQNGYKGLAHKLLEGEAIVRTIGHNAVWLSNKLPEDTLIMITNQHRRDQAVVTALRSTPRFQSLQRVATLKAAVYLTLFFRKHVSLTQARAVTRDDCPICWAPKILQPLHGDKRHGMCCSCKRELERKNMLNRCPMCRVSLRTAPPFVGEITRPYLWD